MTPPPTPPQMSALNKYLTSTGDLPDDVVLGRIVFVTITDEGISHADLTQWFDELALNKDMLPPTIKAIDAFAKATSEAKEKYTLSENREAVVLCRNLANTAEYVKRQITREIRDNRRRKLDYAPAITATFYRGNNTKARLALTLHSNNLEPQERDHMETILDGIQVRFDRYYELHDGNKLRAVVRNYLRGPLNAIEIKGGVYFVHASRDDELGRLTELVSRFGGGCRMHAIPIVNIEAEREFVANAFQQQASQSLADITKEIKDLQSAGKKVTAATWDKYNDRLQALLASAQEHLVTLEVSQDLTAAAAEVAHNALQKLRKEIE